MIRHFLTLLSACLFTNISHAQLSVQPAQPMLEDMVAITYDADAGQWRAAGHQPCLCPYRRTGQREEGNLLPNIERC